MAVVTTLGTIHGGATDRGGHITGGTLGIGILGIGTRGIAPGGRGALVGAGAGTGLGDLGGRGVLTVRFILSVTAGQPAARQAGHGTEPVRLPVEAEAAVSLPTLEEAHIMAEAPMEAAIPHT